MVATVATIARVILETRVRMIPCIIICQGKHLCRIDVILGPSLIVIVIIIIISSSSSSSSTRGPFGRASFVEVGRLVTHTHGSEEPRTRPGARLLRVVRLALLPHNLSLSLSISIYLYIYIYIHIYIYVYMLLLLSLLLIYIYIYIQRERERDYHTTLYLFRTGRRRARQK